MTRYLIRGGTIVSMDPHVGNLWTGDVLIEDCFIVEVAPVIDATDCEVIEASGAIVAPGLIDNHRHVWQSILRSLL